MKPENVRITVAALSLSAAAFIGLVVHEGYTDRAVIPVTGDVPTIGFGTTGGVKMGDTELKVAETAAGIVGRQMEQ